MTVCSRCGKENQAHYKFCLGCGSDLTAVRAAEAAGPAAITAPGPRAEPEDVRDPRDGHDGHDTSDDDHDDPGAATRIDRQAATIAQDAAPVQPLSPAAVVTTPVSATDDAPAVAPPAPARRGGTPAHVPAVSSAPMRACPSCGKPVPYEFVFCGSCGNRMGAAPAPAAPIHTNQSLAAAPAPAPAPRGKLVLIRPDGGEGGSMSLMDGETLIGRTPEPGGLFETDSYLSPKHAYFIFRGGGLVVRDAGSLNGVFVKMSGEEEIADGEVFRLGQELLRFDVIRAAQPLDDGTEVMGSPNPGYWGRLSVILGRGQDGSAFPLFGDSMVVGRERGDILFPEDGYVSGTHARVTKRDGRYFLGDLNSSNGSFLRIRGERALRSGAFLLLGQQLFRVQYV